MKEKSGLILIVVLVLVVFIFVADAFMSAGLKTSLNDVKVVMSEVNKESAQVSFKNLQMEEELRRNGKKLEEMAKINNGLKNKADQSAMALQEKIQELEKKQAELSQMQLELVNAQSACGDPEKVKADELRMKLESSLGMESK